jgi:hypothetical protein
MVVSKSKSAAPEPRRIMPTAIARTELDSAQNQVRTAQDLAIKADIVESRRLARSEHAGPVALDPFSGGCPLREWRLGS